MNEQEPPTPGEQRFKEMVAQLSARVGMMPLDVEMATEGRLKAREVEQLLRQSSESTDPPPEADGAPREETESAG